MKPTRVRDLVSILLMVAALAWGALRIAESRGVPLPGVNWAAPGFLFLLAVAVFVVVLALRPRLRGDKPRPNPLGVARMAVLGKSSAHVGPIVGGLYLGYLVLLLGRLDVDDPRRRALVCVAALVASALLAGAGLLLEWTCRIKDDEDDDSLPPQVPAV